MSSVTQNRGEINMKRKIILRCILIAFLILTVVFGVAEQMQSDISSGIVRLHIIANSDEDADQNVKLAVRDALLEAQKDIFPDGIQKELSTEEKEKIVALSQKVLAENGMTYGAMAETGNWYFPTKKYGNITLPAGNYDGVRVILGEGQGRNWWCVMYPPLCFTESAVGVADEKSRHTLKESMGEFEYEMITGNNLKIKPAIKLVEIWSDIKKKTGDFLS